MSAQQAPQGSANLCILQLLFFSCQVSFQLVQHGCQGHCACFSCCLQPGPELPATGCPTRTDATLLPLPSTVCSCEHALPTARQNIPAVHCSTKHSTGYQVELHDKLYVRTAYYAALFHGLYCMRGMDGWDICHLVTASLEAAEPAASASC